MHHHPVHVGRRLTRVDYVRRVIIAVACAVVLVYADVVRATLSSPRRTRALLWPCLALYAIFAGMWAYTALWLERRDRLWYAHHTSFVRSATAVVVLASALWVLGMWPVYGLWTLPLHLVALTFAAHVVGLLPSLQRIKMKLVQGSVRGRGVRGRGGGRSMRGRGDRRFAARFTDPRFRLSDRVQRSRAQRHTPQEQLAHAARHDPRFASRVTMPKQDESDNDDEEGDEVDDDEEAQVSVDQVEVRSEHDNDDNDDDHDDDDENDDEDVAAWTSEAIEYTSPQRRLAVVNCDWDHVRAVDLYAILFHALPLGGQLHDVCIYQSDFGRRMLEHERVHGPDLWSTDKPASTTNNDDNDNDDNDDDTTTKQHRSDAGVTDATTSRQGRSTVARSRADDDDDDNNSADEADEADASDGWVDDDAAMLYEHGDDGEYFSAGKYRKYEMDRLRYYYAVATFDSAETAAAVYAELDGMDVEASGVVLDLQYVDDAETFTSAPVSRADRVPANFTPLAAFKAAALTQSRFRISWDQEDAFRHTSVQDSFTGTSAEDDLAAYLAPPDTSSDDSDDEKAGDDDDDNNNDNEAKGSRSARATSRAQKLKVRRRYAALLREIGAEPEQLDHDDNDKDDDDTHKHNSKDAHDDDNDKHDDDDDSSSSSDDDDSLNRFSDVELAASDDDNDDDDNDTASLRDGEVTATLDLDTDRKAVQLQREARLRHQAKHGDLATQAELKYKLRRKDAKKAKREALRAERAAQHSTASADRAATRQQLQALMRATDDDGNSNNNNNSNKASGSGANVSGADDAAATRASGKARRKQHAREVKARLADQRVEMRQRRVARQMGVTPTLHKQQAQQAATKALQHIDARFQSQLLHDPRYHIDVAQKDKRVQDDVVRLAGAVAAARHGMRQASTTQTNGSGGRATASSTTRHEKGRGSEHTTSKDSDGDVARAVSYFLGKKRNSASR